MSKAMLLADMIASRMPLHASFRILNGTWRGEKEFQGAQKACEGRHERCRGPKRLNENEKVLADLRNFKDLERIS